MKSPHDNKPRLEVSATRNRMPNCARVIFDRSPDGAIALTKLSGSKYLYKVNTCPDTTPNKVPTHFSPSTMTLAFASNVRFHRFSSFSGAATALRTLLSAEAVTDAFLSESQCMGVNRRVNGDIVLFRDRLQLEV